MTRVLLAEDDEYLHNALRMALTRKGYSVVAVRTGTEAQAVLHTDKFDLLLIDLGLPGVDGTKVLEDFRKRGGTTPIIVITARDTLEDKIGGLDMGANDYLVKPFDVLELEARMRAALRKAQWGNKVEIEVGGLKLDTNSGLVTIGNEYLELTPKEAAVLKTLMSSGGRVVSKNQLMEQVPSWMDDRSENAVEIVVHRLRKKIEASNVAINTVRGFGYVLELAGP